MHLLSFRVFFSLFLAAQRVDFLYDGKMRMKKMEEKSVINAHPEFGKKKLYFFLKFGGNEYS